MRPMSKTPSFANPTYDAEASEDSEALGGATFSLEEGPPVIAAISGARYVAPQELSLIHISEPTRPY